MTPSEQPARSAPSMACRSAGRQPIHVNRCLTTGSRNRMLATAPRARAGRPAAARAGDNRVQGSGALTQAGRRRAGMRAAQSATHRRKRSVRSRQQDDCGNAHSKRSICMAHLVQGLHNTCWGRCWPSAPHIMAPLARSRISPAEGAAGDVPYPTLPNPARRTRLRHAAQRHGQPGAHGERGVRPVHEEVGPAGLQVRQRRHDEAHAVVTPPRVKDAPVPECWPLLRRIMVLKMAPHSQGAALPVEEVHAVLQHRVT